MENEKILRMFLISLIMFLLGFGCLASSWGIRNRMVELQDWKATYESGYCPTCGHKLDN